jgi:hypothetical protein
MLEPSQLKCPRCGSTQLTANKKGFSGTKAVGGAILTGGIGLLAGTIGSNKVKITCLACGKQFNPGEDWESSQKKQKQQAEAMKSPVFWIILSLIIIGIIWLFNGGSNEKISDTNSTAPVNQFVVAKDDQLTDDDIIEMRVPKVGCKWYDDSLHTQQDFLSPFTKDLIDGVILYVTADNGKWLTFRLMPINKGDETGKKYYCRKSQTVEK